MTNIKRGRKTKTYVYCTYKIIYKTLGGNTNDNYSLYFHNWSQNYLLLLPIPYFLCHEQALVSSGSHIKVTQNFILTGLAHEES